jgi:hypothetical protein
LPAWPRPIGAASAGAARPCVVSGSQSISDYDPTNDRDVQPLRRRTLRQVLDRLEVSVARQPRALRIAYINPYFSPPPRVRGCAPGALESAHVGRIKFPVHFYHSPTAGTPAGCSQDAGQDVALVDVAAVRAFKNVEVAPSSAAVCCGASPTGGGGSRTRHSGRSSHTRRPRVDQVAD